MYETRHIIVALLVGIIVGAVIVGTYVTAIEPAPSSSDSVIQPQTLASPVPISTPRPTFTPAPTPNPTQMWELTAEAIHYISETYPALTDGSVDLRCENRYSLTNLADLAFGITLIARTGEGYSEEWSSDTQKEVQNLAKKLKHEMRWIDQLCR